MTRVERGPTHAADFDPARDPILERELRHTTRAPKVRTCLWFEKDGAAAARFYVSLLPDSFLESGSTTEAPLVVEFTLAGAPYMILNGGPGYEPSPAASISVSTADQAETDRLWDALLADGGREGQCGWLTDRYGVSWQIVPQALSQLQRDGDREAAARVHDALMRMKKIDVAALEVAHRGAGGDR